MNQLAQSLRSDLEFSSQRQLGKSYFVVKDPITKRYFRFTENQKVLLDLLKEPSDLSSIARLASENLGGSVAVETVAAFLNSLEDKLLLDTELVRVKLESYRSQKLENRNLLYWKLGSLNPERIFSWLIPRTQWAFSRWFHVFAVLMIGSGFLINFLHFSELTGRVGDLLSLHGVLMIWVVTLAVVTCHEFSHGLTCCHFGGKVQEVGFMLIYFQPAFYCDVSDSWMFPSKKHRMWVMFAGGYFQLVIWGMSTILWRITDTDTIINQLALVIIVFSGLQTLVNFNPLIKFDGYYILSDYLEIPNLRRKSVEMIWDRIAGRPLSPNSAKGPREQRAQLVYGLATIAFSTTLLIYVYAALYTWTTSHYAFAGLVGFVMFSTYTLRRTAAESIAGLRSVAARAAYRKYRNSGIFLAALFISIVGHWDLNIPAEFRVVARNETTVRPETGGIVVDVLVHEGSHVARGEVIAHLRDYDKQQKISDLTGELEKQSNQLTLLRAGARQEEIDHAQSLVNTKKVELSNASKTEEQRNQLMQTLELKKSQLKLDQADLSRAIELDKDGLIPKADLEKYQTAVDVRQREINETEAEIRGLNETVDRDTALKKSELVEAQSALQLLKAGSRPEQIQAAEAEVQRLKDQIRILNEELAKTEVRAPIEGIVTTPFVERKVNSNLEAGDELCKIVDVSRVTIEMQVPEKEMADVQPGNPVSMKFRSFPSLDPRGRVDFIAPVAQTINGQQMVVVRSELPNDDATLKPDMTGVAWIDCGERRIITIMTRRLVRWIRTEFWNLWP
jgi:putative peptide zinc metalloprotease protein